MSRSGYSDDVDDSALNLWRGAVVRAIEGKRGQALLRELVQALDDMPDKRLAAGSFFAADGEFCALGALGDRRGLRLDDLGSSEDGDCDPCEVGRRFGVAPALAAEVMWLNDEGLVLDWVPSERANDLRWQRMRAWAVQNLKEQA